MIIGGPVKVDFVADDGTIITTTLVANDNVTFESDTINLTNTGPNTIEVLVNGKPGTSIGPGQTVNLSVPAQDQKVAAIDDITEKIAEAQDKKTIKELEKAIKRVQKSLDPKLWADDNTLTSKHGHKVFDEEKKAVKSLMKAQKRGDVDVSSIILDLVGIDRQLASDVIDQIPDDVTGKQKKERDKAVAELAKGDDKAGEGKFDKAIDHYKKAWKHAQKALKHDVDDDDDDDDEEEDD